MRWGVGVRVCVTAVDVLLTVMGAIEYCARAVFVWMPLCVLRACECVSEAEGRWCCVLADAEERAISRCRSRVEKLV